MHAGEMNPRATEILEFWFGPRDGDPLAPSARWFKRDEAFDEEIRRRFASDIERAMRGELDAWNSEDARDGTETAARSSLAFVVLLDQFSRNAFRDTPRAFAQDERALEASLAGQQTGRDNQLTWIERYFFYMPMMHAESREMQHRSVANFAHLASEASSANAPDAIVKVLRLAHDFAVRHAAIVEHYGRFPHRNAILSRTSTSEELEFLKQPGSGF